MWVVPGPKPSYLSLVFNFANFNGFHAW